MSSAHLTALISLDGTGIEKQIKPKFYERKLKIITDRYW
jgi:hypothetical protein